MVKMSDKKDEWCIECNIRPVIFMGKLCITCGSCPYCRLYHNYIGVCDWCDLHGITSGDDLDDHTCAVCEQEYREFTAQDFESQSSSSHNDEIDMNESIGSLQSPDSNS